MRFFEFVRKHYGAFFWLCVLYILVDLMLLLLTDWWTERLSGLFLLPLNLISWPVCIEAHGGDGLPLALRRIAAGIVVATTLMPILAICDVL